jgi:hypothetical protein
VRVVDPKSRAPAFVGPRTHARLRHDYATWHPAHVSASLGSSVENLPFEDRSKFDSFHVVDDAITRSGQHPPQVRDGSNQNFVITFDMGYEVGYDARARRRTSAVTVVVSSIGEVITAHPGIRDVATYVTL